MKVHLDRYSCKVCNKNYSGASSLWNHNNKFHKSGIILDNTLIIPDNTLIIHDKKYNCRSCFKLFTNFQNRWKHEKICKNKKEKILELEEKINNLEDKIKNTTINNTINNTTINNTTNNNNGIINNITINTFGKENLYKLDTTEIKKLIKNNNYLVDIIGLLNFNKNLPENHSFCNTSLEGNYVSVLNADSNKIQKINKNKFYDIVLTNSFNKIDDLSLMLELDDTVKETLKDKYKKHLDKNIDHVKELFFTDKVYKNNYKTNINEISYNNKDLVLDTWSKLRDINDDDSVSTLESEDSLTESDNTSLSDLENN
jgi:hypothetical protein